MRTSLLAGLVIGLAWGVTPWITGEWKWMSNMEMRKISWMQMPLKMNHIFLFYLQKSLVYTWLDMMLVYAFVRCHWIRSRRQWRLFSNFIHDSSQTLVIWRFLGYFSSKWQNFIQNYIAKQEKYSDIRKNIVEGIILKADSTEAEADTKLVRARYVFGTAAHRIHVHYH